MALGALALLGAVLAGCSEAGVEKTADGGIDADTLSPDVPVTDVKPADTDPGSDTVDVGTDEGEEDVQTGPKPGEFLYPCQNNEQCYSGWCVDSPEGKICTKTCDSTCPAGWNCSQVGSGADPTFICVPNDTHLCRPCQSDDDCNTPGLPKASICVDAGDPGRYCMRKCGAELGTDCAEGFECQTIDLDGSDGQQVTIDLCVPPDVDHCGCTAKYVKEGATTTCAVTNDYGSCAGVAMCKTQGELPECTAIAPSEEVCNGIDDDCDGTTDLGAVGCESWYQDMDGDGYGQGQGQCLCEQPAGQWVKQGGDCNELVTTINPGAVESCNGLDDDCDGETDEPDAKGCKTHYMDSDGDGWGLDGVTQCLCEGAEGWSSKKGDCNDKNPDQNPDMVEICDGQDNDCDGATDEADAEGCNPFFLDQDGDGFGLTDKVKCLCGPTGAYIADKPGDCNDVEVKINPGVVELCNGVDDNCNGQTDEGEPASMCPEVAHGVAGCVGGSCQLLQCEPGWSDADGDPLNGCECSAGALETPGSPGQSCSAPALMGILSDAGQEIEVTDNISPDGDEDWYHFTALDGPDANGCDSFKVRVYFVHNPQGQFAFDVYKGGCAGTQNTCKQVTEFTDSTNFYDATGGVGGTPKGECPCATGANKEVTKPGVQFCTDQTSVYLVRVYRKPGLASSCAAYTLRMSNGK